MPLLAQKKRKGKKDKKGKKRIQEKIISNEMNIITVIYVSKRHYMMTVNTVIYDRDLKKGTKSLS